MSVQSRVNWVAQQRVDLNHFLSMESFQAFDLRTLVSALSGLDQPYILRGFEAVGKTGLTISIRVRDSLVFNTLDDNGSFLSGDSDADDVLVDLPAEQSNIFVEGRFVNKTREPVNTGFWDPLALTGDDIAGTEFTASTDTQEILVFEITANTVGFSEGAVPILRASTDASSITSMFDSRNLLFRLGRGGATPDPLHKFNWSTSRSEPALSGTGVEDESNSPFRDEDQSGVLNDKGITTLKEWMDAIMTRIAEISGQSIWYDNTQKSLAVGGLDLNTAFFDSDAGHSIQPSRNVTVYWRRNTGGNLALFSQGTSPVKWQSNYSLIEWELGGSFVNNTPGGSRSYSDVRFESPSPAEKGNIYLALEREVPKGSGDAVSWADNSSDSNLDQARAVSGVAGDFTGIAIGDYIRKESEGFQNYYRVAKISDGSVVSTTPDDIADDSIIAIELHADIVTGASSEELRYFRAKYSDDDIVADQTSGQYNNTFINFYWLGRRLNNVFIFRNYGNLQEGEEATTLNDEFVGNASGSGGASDLMLEHAFDAHISLTSEYKLRTGAASTLLTIYRRKRDNTTEFGSTGNEDASLVYTIDAPVGTMNDGDGLWVKLNDNAGGTLANGSVADNSTADEENDSSLATNRWEVLAPEDNPLRNHDNRDVYLIARKYTIDGEPALIFFDGSVLNNFGRFIHGHFEVEGEAKFEDEVYLTIKTPNSILWVGDQQQIEENNAELFWDNDQGADSQGIFGVRNLRITEDTGAGKDIVSQDVPQDVEFLQNLGSHTAKLGDSDSTIHVPGDLVVSGTTSNQAVNDLLVDDKLISLGVGNPSNGGFGSGIEVADDTQDADSLDSSNGNSYVDVTYPSAHSYSTGDLIRVSTDNDVGGITAGEMNGDYEVVASASTAGEAEVVSSTVLRIYTNGTATSTDTNNLGSGFFRTFQGPSYVRMAGADGSLTQMTSWAFKVKGVPTTPTVTPVSGYETVPTADADNMASTRIPFVDPDGQGAGGSDSTLDFYGGFTFDVGTKLFTLDNSTFQANGTCLVVKSTTAYSGFDGESGCIILEPNHDPTSLSDGGAFKLSEAGDARGAHAIDMQTLRGSIADIASGRASVLVGGNSNRATGDYSTVVGATNAQVSGDRAIALGGDDATVLGDSAAIVGGLGNDASGLRSSVVGGTNNNSSGDNATIVGGASNNAQNVHSVAIAGAANTASGDKAVVVAGQTNTSSGENSAILGGANNAASSLQSVVLGGQSNAAQSANSAVVGGENNTASDIKSGILAGANNTVDAFSSAIIGGENHQVTSTGDYSAILGGDTNTVSGLYSSVLGGSDNQVSASRGVVLGGQYNHSSHVGGVVSGQGAITSSNYDVVVGNNNGASAAATSNVHFRVAGDTSNVIVGRHTNQSSVAGAQNTLELHTINANNQSQYIGHKSKDTITSTTTYAWPVAPPNTSNTGTGKDFLTTDDQGSLSWYNVASSAKYGHYGTVQSGAAISYAVQADDYIIPVDTTSSTQDAVINLPAATSDQKGRILHIKDVGGDAGSAQQHIILSPDGTDTIDGDPNFSMENGYMSIQLVCDGNGGWFIL